MKKLFLAVFITAFFLINPLKNVSAHDEVHTFNNVDDDKILLVYYNLEKFQQNLPQTFYLKLYQLTDGRPFEFDSLIISFKKDNKVLKRSVEKVISETPPSFSYDFPQSGKYELEIEALKNSQRITKASFPILVEGTSYVPNSIFPSWQALLLTLVISLGTYYLGTKKIHIHIKNKLTKIQS